MPSSEVEGLKKKLAGMTSRATRAEDSVYALESKVATFKNQLASLRSENDSLRSRATNGSTSMHSVRCLRGHVS